MPMITKSKSLLVALLLFTALYQTGCGDNNTSPYEEAAKKWNSSLPNIENVIGTTKVNVATHDSKITFFSYAHRLQSSAIDHAQFGGFSEWQGFAELNTTPLTPGQSPIKKLAFKINMASVFTSLSINDDNNDPLPNRKALVNSVIQNDPASAKKYIKKASFLDQHLTGEHFFYTGLYPYSEFVSDTIQPNTTAGPHVFTVTGKMFFLGKTLPVQFDASIEEDASGVITAYTYLDPQEETEGLVTNTNRQVNPKARRLIIDLLRFDIGYHGFDLIPIFKDVTVSVDLKFKR